MTGRLVERLGTRVPGLEQIGLTHTFPSPSTLAGANRGRLGLTRARASAIRAFARAVADDEIRLDGSATLENLIASIGALDGLGSWAAHYIALRLGEPDAFPISDLALQRALGGHAPHAVADLGDHAERWQPWRALGATHLWLAEQPSERGVRGAA
jgi:AraC family transcriptional regulator of adaptative response / DNA-3-methyladenine glycosylase II